MKQEDKDKLFMDIAVKVAEQLARKNHDYGDSFHDVYKIAGDTSSWIRLKDKLGRLESYVQGKEFQVEDESVDDIFWDMAGYAILTISSKVRLRKEEEDKHAMDNTSE